VLNEGRNVLGLMPHPERAVDPLLGSADGLPLFRSLLAAVGALGAAPGPFLREKFKPPRLWAGVS